jgi:hypothetical protein
MGPPVSANGGYAAGSLAAALGGGPGGAAVEVTLRRPPPLETPLTITVAGAQAELLDAGGAVATARVVDESPPGEVPPVPYAEAVAASSRYRGWQAHPFPTCFGCGTARSAPDALALRPGPVGDGSRRTACVWTPDAALAPDPAVLWAALDCPGGWTVDLGGRPAVLGRMSARILTAPVIGEPHVVVGRLLDRSGRKSFTATALYDSAAGLVAHARAVWIEIDPAAFVAKGIESSAPPS